MAALHGAILIGGGKCCLQRYAQMVRGTACGQPWAVDKSPERGLGDYWLIRRLTACLLE
jgi:hypothetical protein